jgi:hypothetical protein
MLHYFNKYPKQLKGAIVRVTPRGGRPRIGEVLGMARYKHPFRNELKVRHIVKFYDGDPETVDSLLVSEVDMTRPARIPFVVEEIKLLRQNNQGVPYSAVDFCSLAEYLFSLAREQRCIARGSRLRTSSQRGMAARIERLEEGRGHTLEGESIKSDFLYISCARNDAHDASKVHFQFPLHCEWTLFFPLKMNPSFLRIIEPHHAWPV